MQPGSPILTRKCSAIEEFWKPIYFGVKRSKVKITSHKNTAGVGFCTLAQVFKWRVLAHFERAGVEIALL